MFASPPCCLPAVNSALACEVCVLSLISKRNGGHCGEINPGLKSITMSTSKQPRRTQPASSLTPNCKWRQKAFFPLSLSLFHPYSPPSSISCSLASIFPSLIPSSSLHLSHSLFPPPHSPPLPLSLSSSFHLLLNGAEWSRALFLISAQLVLSAFFFLPLMGL